MQNQQFIVSLYETITF